MKVVSLLLLLTFFLPFTATARENFDLVKVKELKEFIKTKNLCYLALARVGNKEKELVLDPFYCVIEGTSGKGTLHELNGCSVVKMNASNGTVMPLLGNGTPMIPKKLDKVKCDKDGVLKAIDIDIKHYTAMPADMLTDDIVKTSARKYMEDHGVIVLQDDFSVWKK